MRDAASLGDDKSDIYRRVKPSVMSRRPSRVHSSTVMSCEPALARPCPVDG